MGRTNHLDVIACVSITTPRRALFYLQEKDDEHPIPVFRGKYAFFGGKAEQDESSYKAAQRELEEELTIGAARAVIPRLTLFLTLTLQCTYLLPKKKYCTVHLYEAMLPERVIRTLAQLPIYEGKRGVLVSRDDFSASLFPHHLRPLIEKYESFW